MFIRGKKDIKRILIQVYSTILKFTALNTNILQTKTIDLSRFAY